MADQEHVEILKQGVKLWNAWRKKNPNMVPDLSETDLNGVNLSGANLHKVNLRGTSLIMANLGEAELQKADLSGTDLNGADLLDAIFTKANLTKADLRGVRAVRANFESANFSNANLSEANFNLTYLPGANLKGANLSKTKFEASQLYYVKFNDANLSQGHFPLADFWCADLRRADLSQANLASARFKDANLGKANLTNAYLSAADLRNADLRKANLRGANLKGADLTDTDLSKSDLSSADLSYARLIRTDLTATLLNNSRVYGVSAWDVELHDTQQESLIITPEQELSITVDNLKVAQFFYLLLNNEEIRDVINSMTTKVVLILGRFTSERKVVLDALRDALRQHNYLPVLFDFEKPSNRNLTETVRTIAHLARFIIADLTDPSSIPHELQAIVPNLAIPVQPLLLDGKKDYAMFTDFRRYHWVLPIYCYKDQESLISSLQKSVIEPAESKAKELELA